MAPFVVDPAVTVKWFVPETFSDSAARLLDGGSELAAPDTLLADSAKIITFKTRLGQLSDDEGCLILEAIRSVPLMFLPSDPLLEPALRIASKFEIPFIGGLSLAAAVQIDGRLVTADRDFYESFQGTTFAMHVKWVGDIR